MQYTIRNIPPSIDRELRDRAHKRRESLNKTVVETLMRGLGIGQEEPAFADLDDLIGTWIPDEEFDRAVADQDTVDEDQWR